MRRTVDVWIGAVLVVVLMLVLGVLLLRVSADSTDDRAARTLPGSGAGRDVLTLWRGYVAEGARLHIDFEGDPCVAAGDVVVDEDADKVVVTLYVRAPAGPCVSIAVGHRAEAELDAPLGSRVVYDGGCLRLSGRADDPACVRSPD